MITYTTPKHEFLLDCDPSQWLAFRITYKQKNKVILEKKETDEGISFSTIEGYPVKYSISYTLTQAETGKFSGKDSCEVQIKFKDVSGAVSASEPIHINVFDAFNTEVL